MTRAGSNGLEGPSLAHPWAKQSHHLPCIRVYKMQGRDGGADGSALSLGYKLPLVSPCSEEPVENRVPPPPHVPTSCEASRQASCHPRNGGSVRSIM